MENKITENKILCTSYRKKLLYQKNMDFFNLFLI